MLTHSRNKDKTSMPPKRIILMYISEVSGHHSATKAIEKAVKIISPETEVLNINGFNYTNPISEKIINRIYMNVIQRAPKIWDYLYDNPNVVKKLEKIKQAVHKFNSPKLKNLFDKFKPDVIACSQAFPCGMAADFKKTYNCKIPLVAVLTDYVPHAYWIYDTIDYYISPSDEVKKRLIDKGVKPDRIKPFGIPIDPKFSGWVDKNMVNAKLKLDPETFNILIMGGGHGLGPVKTIIKYLDTVKNDFNIIAVAGINDKLYNLLQKQAKKTAKKIIILKYADNIDELMSISKLIITKPGGITTAEALAKKLPIIIINPIPGQEANNTIYLTKQHAAIKINQLNQIGKVIEGLFSDLSRLTYLSESCARISKPNSSLDIAKLLLELGGPNA